MIIYVKLLAAAAAVLVVAVVGYQLIPRHAGPGTPTATPSPAATPQPTAVPPLPVGGPLDAGTYRTGSGPTFLVTVPSGWVSVGGTSVRKNLDQANEVALEMYRADILVFANACQSAGTEESIGPTTADLIAALMAQENSEISEAVDVTVGGLPGKRVEISAPADLNVSQCSIGSLQVWVDGSGTNYLAGVHPGAPATAYVADTPGGRLLLVPHNEDASSADIAERDAILASIEIVE